MTATMDVVDRALKSKGTSTDAVYQLIDAVLRQRADGGVLLDVGCGTGNLAPVARKNGLRYVGVDVVRYDAFPAEEEFVSFDLDAGRAPLPDQSAEVVAAVETIEHLENPRAFLRELVRLTKPGGLVLVTTPNNLSFLSLLSLLVKSHFNAFLDPCYPAHITALVATDLRRMARECSLEDPQIHWSLRGRIPGTGRH